ncbi:MAG: NADH-quinone oxidoreductase subunit J [Actinomycetota bacterium]
MSGPEFFLVLFGVVSGISAVGVVTSRNVVRAALALVGVLGGLGIIFILLGAEFVGWTQILVYVGAIVVLLLFGLMLTAAPIGRVALDNEQRGIALFTSVAVFSLFTTLIWRAFGDQEIPLEQIVRTEDVGRSIFTNFILPFEVVSVVLLAALVGAILLSRKDESR